MDRNVVSLTSFENSSKVFTICYVTEAMRYSLRRSSKFDLENPSPSVLNQTKLVIIWVLGSEIVFL